MFSKHRVQFILSKQRGGIFMFNNQYMNTPNQINNPLQQVQGVNPADMNHLQYQQMMQQMMAQQQMTQQQMLQQQAVQNQLMYQKEQERQMKQLQNLQRKQYEIIHGVTREQMREMQLPRLTKSVAEDFIAMYLGLSQYKSQMTFIKMVEPLDFMKHACLSAGVVKNPVQVTYYGTTQIIMGFCNRCGTVHYYFDNEGGTTYNGIY